MLLSSLQALADVVLRFAVSQHGLVRISGHWAAGGREVLPEKQDGHNWLFIITIRASESMRGFQRISISTSVPGTRQHYGEGRGCGWD